jgi:GNAT superfamily N-acetyltransferase
MSLLEFRPVDPSSPDALELIRALGDEYARRYPDTSFYGIDVEEFPATGGTFVVGYLDERPVACGSFRPLDGGDVAEIMRMFVKGDYRRQGISRKLLAFLEESARDLAFAKVCLETGIRQPEAIGLYRSSGYVEIPPFGIYVGHPLSVCFEKPL